MSIFKKILGRKNDEFGLDETSPNLGLTPGFNEPLGSPDMSSPEAEAHLGSPATSMPNAPPPSPHRSLTPEALGFERVTEKESRLAHEQRVGEINFSKDLEIISAKLDAIKAELDSMNQRLKRLERLAEGESSFSKDKWSY